MKKMTLIFTNGNKATYNESDLVSLEESYKRIKEYVLYGNATFFTLMTKNKESEILVNVANLIAIDVEY